jgi:molybdopterin/thiamine biosynthesis adenylyltransferase
MRYTLTIREEHYNELRSHLIKEDGFERPAILLCGRSATANDIWDGGSEERFLSKMVIPVPESEIIVTSATEVQWDTGTFRKALKLAEKDNLAVCLVHNHPNGALSYSKVDDEYEPALIQSIFNRNGGDRAHASIVITPDGDIFGRAWTKYKNPRPLSMIRVLGNRFRFHYPDKHKSINREIFDRQQLAFGTALNNDLSKLKVGIIGCGATGSATAHLLSRIGVGQLLLLDNDLVERSNLSRLHGPTASDADAGRAKTEALRDYITGAGIGTRVRTIKNWVGSEESRDAIKTCDIIFGCTDDNAGRIFLNRFAPFYLIPVFDMGIVIEPSKEEPTTILALQGRLTVIYPGNICLLCKEIVSPKLAAEENLKRSDPLGFERQKEEAYVIGGGNPSPAVITFTTEVATMSVNELLNRITGFKKNGAENNIMRFFDRCEDGKPGAKRREDCPICSNNKYWGKGDMRPFLDQAN